MTATNASITTHNISNAIILNTCQSDTYHHSFCNTFLIVNKLMLSLLKLKYWNYLKMETLYHQTNQLIQETSELFQKLDKDPSNYEGIENAIQSKINAISA